MHAARVSCRCIRMYVCMYVCMYVAVVHATGIACVCMVQLWARRMNTCVSLCIISQGLCLISFGIWVRVLLLCDPFRFRYLSRLRFANVCSIYSHAPTYRYMHKAHTQTDTETHTHTSRQAVVPTPNEWLYLLSNFLHTCHCALTWTHADTCTSKTSLQTAT
jgi:hypothetical protein